MWVEASQCGWLVSPRTYASLTSCCIGTLLWVERIWGRWVGRLTWSRAGARRLHHIPQQIVRMNKKMKPRIGPAIVSILMYRGCLLYQALKPKKGILKSWFRFSCCWNQSALLLFLKHSCSMPMLFGGFSLSFLSRFFFFFLREI